MTSADKRTRTTRGRNSLLVAAFPLAAFAGQFLFSAAIHAAEPAAALTAANALAYQDASDWFWGLNQFVGLALPFGLLITGWGARLFRFAASTSRQRRLVWLASFAALYFLLDRSLRVPIAYLWDRAYDLATGAPSQSLMQWFGHQMTGWMLSVGGLTLVAMVGYWLIEKSARWWWLWASAAASILVLAALLGEPFTQAHEQLGDSPLQQRAADLAARAGVPRAAMVIEHCDPPSACPPGRVIGLGPTRLILLNDALLALNPESWTLLTVAHEAKHFAKDDNRKAFVLLSGLAVGALWFVHRAGRAIIARWSARLGFAEVASPAFLPLAVLLFNIFYLLALPPVNAFRQDVELEADRFALELTRDNSAQSQMLASWALESGRPIEWSRFFRLFRASHPSDAERIRLSDSYHPWLEGKPLVYADDFAAPLEE